MKIVLIPGHSVKEQGAVVCAGPYEGISEYELARSYLPDVGAELSRLGFEVVYTTREAAGGSSPRCSARAANATRADVALEFHFNSFAGTASGAEVLYWRSSAPGGRFAAALSARLAACLGVPDRGGKPISTPRDRGYRAFRDSRMPFFMLEPCFAGSEPGDAEQLGSLLSTGTWAREVAAAIAEALDIAGFR